MLNDLTSYGARKRARVLVPKQDRFLLLPPAAACQIPGSAMCSTLREQRSHCVPADAPAFPVASISGRQTSAHPEIPRSSASRSVFGGFGAAVFVCAWRLLRTFHRIGRCVPRLVREPVRTSDAWMPFQASLCSAHSAFRALYGPPPPLIRYFLQATTGDLPTYRSLPDHEVLRGRGRSP
jgi:hypothetical protein